ncbi:MAG: hypothetical protein AAGF48_15480 [Pseudomonadota bacterium]
MTINTAILPPTMLTNTGEVKPEFQDVAADIATGIQAKLDTLPPGQQAMFLSIVKSPSFAPTAQNPNVDLDAAEQKLDVMLDKLEKLFNAAGGGNEIAELFLEMAQLQRKDALNSRLLAREAAMGQMIKEAGKMMDAADEMRKGAIFSLVFTVVAAAVTVAAAGFSARGQMKSLNGQKTQLEGDQMANSGSQMQKMGQANKDIELETAGTGKIAAGKAKSIHGIEMQGSGVNSTLKNQILNSFSQLLQGIGRAGEGFWNANAKDKEAEGRMIAADAEFQRSQGDIDRDIQNAMMEMANKIIEFVKQLKEAEVNQMAAITKG